MRSRPGVGNSDFRKPSYAGVVIDGSIIVQDAAVPVIRVGAQTDIGDDAKRREAFANRPDRANGRSIFCVGGGAVRILSACGDAKDEDRLQAIGEVGFEEFVEPVDGPPMLAGHGLNRLPGLVAIRDEDGVHELVCIEFRLRFRPS
jgi:hypothetical protein